VVATVGHSGRRGGRAGGTTRRGGVGGIKHPGPHVDHRVDPAPPFFGYRLGARCLRADPREPRAPGGGHTHGHLP
jgi:hypothetical protein